MKTAVETIFTGKERLYNRRFLQMAMLALLAGIAIKLKIFGGSP